MLLLNLKLSKARVTDLVCANASSTHSLLLFMIGEANKPCHFKNVTCLPLTNNVQKIMYELKFMEWYTNNLIPSFQESVVTFTKKNQKMK